MEENLTLGRASDSLTYLSLFMAGWKGRERSCGKFNAPTLDPPTGYFFRLEKMNTPLAQCSGGPWLSEGKAFLLRV